MAKTKNITITNDESILLKHHKKYSPVALIRLKADAVLLASRSVSLDTICYLLDRQVYTVTSWLRDWRKQRMSSIFSGHMGNSNAGKLTKEQLDEIQHTLQSPPSDYGLPKEFWDVPELKTYVSTHFNTVYESDRSYHHLLQFSNLSFKYADAFDLKRNEVLIVERMKAIKKELAPLLNDASWEVFACDEVRMDQEAIIRKAWLQKGKRTIIKVNRTKESQSYIGFLNQKNGMCEIFEMPWQRSGEVLKAYKQFLKAHPNKKIAVVWDNAPFHKSKEIREQLRVGGLLESVHLIAMPPYAPDHNPIEHVWNTAKQAVAGKQYATFEQTREAFTGFIQKRTFNYAF